MKKVSPIADKLEKLYKVYITILVVALLSGIYKIKSLNNAPDWYNPEIDLLPAEIIYMLVGFAQTAMIIIIFIHFLIWLHRLTKNITEIHKKSLPYTPGWAVASFFIPVISLWRPYNHIKQIFIKCSQDIENQNFIKTWWILWLVSNWIGRFVFGEAIDNWDKPADSTSVTLYLLSDGFDLVLYYMEFNLVRKISKLYRENLENQLDQDNTLAS